MKRSTTWGSIREMLHHPATCETSVWKGNVGTTHPTANLISCYITYERTRPTADKSSRPQSEEAFFAAYVEHRTVEVVERREHTMLYRRIALWILPLLVLLLLATFMLFAQLTTHIHAAPVKHGQSITTPTATPTPSGGVIPNVYWHG